MAASGFVAPIEEPSSETLRWEVSESGGLCGGGIPPPGASAVLRSSCLGIGTESEDSF